jgi:hypothetical protein
MYMIKLFEKVAFFYCQIFKRKNYTKQQSGNAKALTASLKLKFMYHKALAVLLTCKSYNVNCLLNLVL